MKRVPFKNDLDAEAEENNIPSDSRRAELVNKKMPDECNDKDKYDFSANRNQGKDKNLRNGNFTNNILNDPNFENNFLIENSSKNINNIFVKNENEEYKRNLKYNSINNEFLNFDRASNLEEGSLNQNIYKFNPFNQNINTDLQFNSQNRELKDNINVINKHNKQPNYTSEAFSNLTKDKPDFIYNNSNNQTNPHTNMFRSSLNYIQNNNNTLSAGNFTNFGVNRFTNNYNLNFYNNSQSNPQNFAATSYNIDISKIDTNEKSPQIYDCLSVDKQESLASKIDDYEKIKMKLQQNVNENSNLNNINEKNSFNYNLKEQKNDFIGCFTQKINKNNLRVHENNETLKSNHLNSFKMENQHKNNFNEGFCNKNNDFSSNNETKKFQPIQNIKSIFNNFQKNNVISSKKSKKKDFQNNFSANNTQEFLKYNSIEHLNQNLLNDNVINSSKNQEISYFKPLNSSQNSNIEIDSEIKNSYSIVSENENARKLVGSFDENVDLLAGSVLNNSQIASYSSKSSEKMRRSDAEENKKRQRKETPRKNEYQQDNISGINHLNTPNINNRFDNVDNSAQYLTNQQNSQFNQRISEFTQQNSQFLRNSNEKYQSKNFSDIINMTPNNTIHNTSYQPNVNNNSIINRTISANDQEKIISSNGGYHGIHSKNFEAPQNISIKYNTNKILPQNNMPQNYGNFYNSPINTSMTTQSMIKNHVHDMNDPKYVKGTRLGGVSGVKNSILDLQTRIQSKVNIEKSSSNNNFSVLNNKVWNNDNVNNGNIMHITPNINREPDLNVNQNGFNVSNHPNSVVNTNNMNINNLKTPNYQTMSTPNRNIRSFNQENAFDTKKNINFDKIDAFNNIPNANFKSDTYYQPGKQSFFNNNSNFSVKNPNISYNNDEYKTVLAKNVVLDNTNSNMAHMPNNYVNFKPETCQNITNSINSYKNSVSGMDNGNLSEFSNYNIKKFVLTQNKSDIVNKNINYNQNENKSTSKNLKKSSFLPPQNKNIVDHEKTQYSNFISSAGITNNMTNFCVNDSSYVPNKNSAVNESSNTQNMNIHSYNNIRNSRFSKEIHNNNGINNINENFTSRENVNFRENTYSEKNNFNENSNSYPRFTAQNLTNNLNGISFGQLNGTSRFFNTQKNNIDNNMNSSLQNFNANFFNYNDDKTNKNNVYSTGNDTLQLNRDQKNINEIKNNFYSAKPQIYPQKNTQYYHSTEKSHDLDNIISYRSTENQVLNNNISISHNQRISPASSNSIYAQNMQVQSDVNNKNKNNGIFPCSTSQTPEKSDYRNYQDADISTNPLFKNQPLNTNAPENAAYRSFYVNNLQKNVNSSQYNSSLQQNHHNNVNFTGKTPIKEKSFDNMTKTFNNAFSPRNQLPLIQASAVDPFYTKNSSGNNYIKNPNLELKITPKMQSIGGESNLYNVNSSLNHADFNSNNLQKNTKKNSYRSENERIENLYQYNQSQQINKNINHVNVHENSDSSNKNINTNILNQNMEQPGIRKLECNSFNPRTFTNTSNLTENQVTASNPNQNYNFNQYGHMIPQNPNITPKITNINNHTQQSLQNIHNDHNNPNQKFDNSGSLFRSINPNRNHPEHFFIQKNKNLDFIDQNMKENKNKETKNDDNKNENNINDDKSKANNFNGHNNRKNDSELKNPSFNNDVTMNYQSTPIKNENYTSNPENLYMNNEDATNYMKNFEENPNIQNCNINRFNIQNNKFTKNTLQRISNNYNLVNTQNDINTNEQYKTNISPIINEKSNILTKKSDGISSNTGLSANKYSPDIKNYKNIQDNNKGEIYNFSNKQNLIQNNSNNKRKTSNNIDISNQTQEFQVSHRISSIYDVSAVKNSLNSCNKQPGFSKNPNEIVNGQNNIPKHYTHGFKKINTSNFVINSNLNPYNNYVRTVNNINKNTTENPEDIYVSAKCCSEKLECPYDKLLSENDIKFYKLDKKAARVQKEKYKSKIHYFKNIDSKLMKFAKNEYDVCEENIISKVKQPVNGVNGSVCNLSNASLNENDHKNGAKIESKSNKIITDSKENMESQKNSDFVAKNEVMTNFFSHQENNNEISGQNVSVFQENTLKKMKKLENSQISDVLNDKVSENQNSKIDKADVTEKNQEISDCKLPLIVLIIQYILKQKNSLNHELLNKYIIIRLQENLLEKEIYFIDFMKLDENINEILESVKNINSENINSAGKKEKSSSKNVSTKELINQIIENETRRYNEDPKRYKFQCLGEKINKNVDNLNSEVQNAENSKSKTEETLELLIEMGFDESEFINLEDDENSNLLDSENLEIDSMKFSESKNVYDPDYYNGAGTVKYYKDGDDLNTIITYDNCEEKFAMNSQVKENHDS